MAENIELLSQAIDDAAKYREQLQRLQDACVGWNASLRHQLTDDIAAIELTFRRLRDAKDRIELLHEQKGS